jgi:hypothetical protein
MNLGEKNWISTSKKVEKIYIERKESNKYIYRENM